MASVKSKWSTDKPTTPGKYRMRDTVFGWGPVEVLIIATVVGLNVHVENAAVRLKDISNWVEFRKVGEL